MGEDANPALTAPSRGSCAPQDWARPLTLEVAAWCMELPSHSGLAPNLTHAVTPDAKLQCLVQGARPLDGTPEQCSGASHEGRKKSWANCDFFGG